MRRLIVPLSLSLALAVPAAVSAQSMGEAAAKEKARREKLRQGKPAPKVITEEDLRSSSRARGTVSNPAATEAVDANAAPAADASAASSAAPAPAQKSDEELVTQRRMEWRERMTRAQADVQNLSQRLDQLQLRANDVSGNLYGASRATLLSELETTRTLLATARQTLATLEDEGRRNNFQM